MAKTFDIQYRFIAKNVFSAAGRKIHASTKQIGKGFDKLTLQAKKLGKAVGGLRKKFNSNIAQMVAGFASFAAIRGFLNVGMRFQDAIADLGAISGATGKDLKFLSDESLRLAKASSIAQDQVATAFKLIASAKSELLTDPKGLSRVTEQVLLLSNAAGIELDNAAQVVTESLNQFGAGADRAAEFVNILAAGSKIGASEVGQTGVAIVKAGVAAKLAKVSFLETNAAIQVLAKSGLKAEVAGTGLQAMFLKLEAKGPKRFKPSVVGLSKALQNLKDVNLTATQATKLFGEEHIKTGLALVNNVSTFNEFKKAMEGTNEAQRQADIRLGTFSAKMRKIKVLVNDALIKTFVRLEPVLTKNAERFTAWLETIDDRKIQGFADTLAFTADVLVTIGKGLNTFIIQPLVKIAQLLGEITAAVATLDFGNLTGGASQSLKDLAGMTPTGMIKNLISEGDLFAGHKSFLDIGMDIRAPEGVVQKIEAKSDDSMKFRTGVQMEGG